MKVKIADLMRPRVITAQPHHTVDHVRRLCARNRIHAVPVLDHEGAPIGIVSTADLATDVSATAPVKRVMTSGVRTIARYDDVSVAARLMRRHRIHHLVVTHEKRVVGILSSLDLLALLENHRFSAKATPTPSKRAAKRA